MDAINPSSPADHLGSSVAIAPGRTTSALRLMVNQVLKASVLKGGQDQAVLDLKGQKILAETNLPLQTGQKLELLVTAVSPRVELQIITDFLRDFLTQSAKLLGRQWNFAPFAELLGAADKPSPPLSQLARQFLEAWSAMPDKILGAHDGSVIRQLLRSFRLFPLLPEKGAGREASFSDLLLEVTHNLPEDDELAGLARALSQELDFLQLCQLKLAQQQIGLFPLPLPFLAQGFLTVADDRPAGDDQNKIGPRICLHMTLQGLGDLKVDIYQQASGLFVRFFCESAAKAVFVSDFADELRQALGGLALSGLSFAAGADNPTKVLIDLIKPAGDAILDTRV